MVNKKEIKVMQLDWLNQIFFLECFWLHLKLEGELFFALVSGI